MLRLRQLFQGLKADIQMWQDGGPRSPIPKQTLLRTVLQSPTPSSEPPAPSAHHQAPPSSLWDRHHQHKATPQQEGHQSPLPR
jgi:hypothetical protein